MHLFWAKCHLMPLFSTLNAIWPEDWIDAPEKFEYQSKTAVFLKSRKITFHNYRFSLTLDSQSC